MTPKQLNLFLRATSRRRTNEILTDMNVRAAAASAAFTGNTKPMESIEKALTGTSDSYGSEIQKRLKGFARAVGANIK